MQLADDLGEVADSLIGHFVDQARRAGASWSEIGRSTGMIKQAAQKRFVSKESRARTCAVTTTARARSSNRLKPDVRGNGAEATA